MESAEETCNPVAACRFCKHWSRQCKGEEGGQRRRTHRCKIAEPAGQAAVSCRFRRMQVAAEVPALQRKVGRDKDFGPGRRTQTRAIISDAERYRLAAGGKIAANLLDQAQLSPRI